MLEELTFVTSYLNKNKKQEAEFTANNKIYHSRGWKKKQQPFFCHLHFRYLSEVKETEINDQLIKECVLGTNQVMCEKNGEEWYFWEAYVYWLC